MEIDSSQNAPVGRVLRLVTFNFNRFHSPSGLRKAELGSAPGVLVENIKPPLESGGFLGKEFFADRKKYNIEKQKYYFRQYFFPERKVMH